MLTGKEGNHGGEVEASGAVKLLAAAASALLTVSGCAPHAAVQFDGWTAFCSSLEEQECEGIAQLFVNNLAWDEAAIHRESGGRIVVEPRSACPGSLPEWADRSSCWQAFAHASMGEVCMVIARHEKAQGAVSTFGQVGGDEMTGRAGGPATGWPVCE